MREIIDLPIADVLLHSACFYRRKVPNIDRLATSMAGPNGQLQPVIVDGDNHLIIGLRRFTAAKKLGWKTIKAVRIDLENPLDAIRDENDEREPLSIEERVELGKLIEATEVEKAKYRQGRAGSERSGKLPEHKEQEKGESREKAAEAVGMSRHTYEAAKTVVDNAVPEIIEQVDAGNMPVSTAAEAAKLSGSRQKAIAEYFAEGRAKEGRKAIKAANGHAKKLERQPGDDEQEDPITDAGGIDVPAHARAAFHAVKDIEVVCRKIDAIRHEIDANKDKPGWESLLLDSITQALTNARQTLYQSRPMHVCPYCGGKGEKRGEKCNCCKGRGWTIKATYSQWARDNETAASARAKHLG
jgi:ParB family chromosome partitioning protein